MSNPEKQTPLYVIMAKRRALRKRRTILSARSEALSEAADHLDQDWTTDPEERSAGNWVAERLRKQAIHCSIEAAAIERRISEL